VALSEGIFAKMQEHLPQIRLLKHGLKKTVGEITELYHVVFAFWAELESVLSKDETPAFAFRMAKKFNYTCVFVDLKLRQNCEFCHFLQ
jgi:hypothetical protein